MTERVLGFKKWLDEVLCNTEVKCPACIEVLHFLESMKKAGYIVNKKGEVVSLEEILTEIDNAISLAKDEDVEWALQKLKNRFQAKIQAEEQASQKATKEE